jgi:hypothetical protein
VHRNDQKAGLKSSEGATVQKKEEFLKAVANISYTKGDERAKSEAESVLKRFPEYLPPEFVLVGSTSQREPFDDIPGPETTAADRRTEAIQRVWVLTAYFRRIWNERDPKRRNWLIYRARDKYASVMSPGRSFFDSPAPSAFEDAMLIFEEKVKALRLCANPDCPAKYFIARNDRPVTYCSSKCAGPAKRAAKLKWWNENRRKAAKAKR